MDWQFKVGLGATVVFGLLQFVVASMPHFLTYSGIGVGVLLIIWGIFPNILHRWIPKRSKVKETKHTIQQLYDKIIKIGERKWDIHWGNISDARSELNEWKVVAKRLIYRLFGQEELNNILEKISYIEERNEYINPSIGGIEAFYNEKQIYLKYLEDLLDSLENHPELWG